MHSGCRSDRAPREKATRRCCVPGCHGSPCSSPPEIGPDARQGERRLDREPDRSQQVVARGGVCLFIAPPRAQRNAVDDCVNVQRSRPCSADMSRRIERCSNGRCIGRPGHETGQATLLSSSSRAAAAAARRRIRASPCRRHPCPPSPAARHELSEQQLVGEGSPDGCPG